MAGVQTKLSAKLKQGLTLTPQLAQSLKVLAMNAVELDTYLETCLESNPLLEAETESLTPTPAEAETENADEPWQESGDDRWESMYSSAAREGSELPDRDQQWRDEQTLSQSLHEQIDCQPMDEAERPIAHALIDSLDDDGYFRGSFEELATALETTPARIVEVLECVVQELEPAGIGARDLSECLLLQLNDDDDVTRLARRLLLHHTDELLEADDKLARKAGCSAEELAQARLRMRRLDPFPGHGMHGDPGIYVRPELAFRITPDGDTEVEVLRSGHQKLRISHQWDGHEWKGAERKFMDDAMREAKALLQMLDQRSETLMKVGLCLARRQRAFLEHGILGLKPLTLQDVAEEVELHESTVSRVTNGKYAQTPIGILEMRRFFSAGLPTRGGGTISVYRAQQRVKTLIEAEEPGKPISDQAIADQLQREGIEIARRTVAKYREQLGLPPSSLRRRAAKSRPQQKRG
jgi:RNA polymerase sigma-54 factor